MNRPDNKTCCLMFLLILGLMIAGCASASDYIDAKMDEPPPDELIALLDSPKRLVRALDGNHTIDTEEADEAAFQIIRKLNGAGSGYWRDFDYLYYYRMRGIRYSYKNSYLYQIYSPMRVLPMAILIPMDQGIVVIVNPYEPAPSCSYELFPGTPWDFDE